ncbi:unnamed protein product [Mytilus edulis]|uniref:Uncharacterized protein n=1 Tax=Mytilus edulis TaxID=6550 RepID=A0A8S3UEK8_MYTED|nr:unnamed protein product [Mytilus edulis]
MDNPNDNQSLTNNSCKLYHYLSDKFGSKTIVTYRRYTYKCFDDCMQNADIRIISSGSKAEGLDLPGSDLDLMLLSNEIVVYENVPDGDKDTYLLDTENASIGFAFIKVPKGFSNCVNVTNTFNGFLLTNKYIKEQCARELEEDKYFMGILRNLLKIQGPSVSLTFQGIVEVDVVLCYPCHEWPSVANKWIVRSRISNWPSENLITASIDEGVLLVPVGNRSLNFFLYRIRNEKFPTSLKNTYAIAFLDYSRSKALSINMLPCVSVSNCNKNKHYYSKYKQCLFHLLLSRQSDAVSGWLLLAVFFYSSEEYRKMIDVLQISKKFFSRDLIQLTWWNLPTLDQSRCKKMIIRSKFFLKRLRTSFSKSVAISKNNKNENGFVFHKDLTITNEDFCIGSPLVYHRYLTFLYAYRIDSTREITIALQSLKEVVENSIDSDILTILADYICLFKAQQLVGSKENYSTYQRMLPILSSSDTKHIFSTLNKMF